MLSINKILFPTDSSECAEHAFSHAAHLAALFDAELHVFNTKISQSDEYPALKHLLDEFEDADVEDLPGDRVQRSIPAGKDRVIVVEAGSSGPSACAAILNYVEEHEIDIIVMGTHGWRGPRRMLIGSTTECIVRKAPCPVLSLRMEADAPRNWDLTHILVPVDYSQFSKQAVIQANELARLVNAKITLVHVLEEMAIPTVYGIEPVALPQMEHLIDRSNKELQQIKDEIIDGDIKVEYHTLIGRPSFLITELAKDNEVDLIMMSTHGHTGLKRFMMGSVAESIIRISPCAVLTIKSFKDTHQEEASEKTEAVSL